MKKNCFGGISGFGSEALRAKARLKSEKGRRLTLFSIPLLSYCTSTRKRTQAHTHTSVNSETDPTKNLVPPSEKHPVPHVLKHPHTNPLHTETHHTQNSPQRLYPLIYGCLIYRNIKRAEVRIPVDR